MEPVILLESFESREDVLAYLEAVPKAALESSRACGADGRSMQVRTFVTPSIVVRLAERPTWFGWEIEAFDPRTGRRRTF